jgi:hypothetical protein
MNQIYPDAGLLQWMGRMVVGDFHYHLYTNNVVPDKSTTLGVLTEATWAGYAVITVTAAAFTLSGITGHIGSLLAAPISFTNTSGMSQTAYGYYVTDTADSILFAVALFDSPPVTILNGGVQLATPIIGDFSQF